MSHDARTLPPAAMMILSLLASAESAAQSLGDLRLGAWGGSLELGYGRERQQVSASGGNPGITSARRRIEERLTLRNEGFSYIDPRLVSGNLALTFGLVRERTSTDGTESSLESTLPGYAFDTTFLGGLPYSGTLYANRSESFLSQPFGRSVVAAENRGLTLRLREDSFLRDWGFPFFNASLRAEQQHTKEDTTSILGQGFRRDELRNTLGLDAHKGFETSDLDLHYEFSDLSNSTFPAASFQSQTANLHYSLDFGSSLSRRFDTLLSYYTHSGASRFSLFSADERLHVDHQQNLSTSYSYGLTRTDADTGASSTQSGAFDVRHKPYRDLDTSAQVVARHHDLPAGTRDSYGGQVALHYQRELARGSAAFVRVTTRYQIDDNRLAASQINMIDEPHTAPTPLGAGAGFLLDQSFVIASSIVVVDTRGGARLATTAGVDYDIVAEGDLTRIVPLPTSAVIQAGDPLAVSYTYEINPSIKYSTASGTVSGGVDLRWIAFSVSHEQADQELISGEDGRFLQDIRRDSAQVDLRGGWETLRAQAGAGYVRYDGTRLAYTEQRYTQLVSYRATRTLGLGLNADQTLTDFTLPVHETKANSIRLTVDWYAASGWATTAFAGRRVHEDTLQPTETIKEASVRTRWAYGKLDLSAAVAAIERLRGDSRLTSWRADMLATRRF